MSESEGKKELGGLARSIDSLFSNAPAAPDDSEGAESDSAPEPRAPDASPAPPDGSAGAQGELVADAADPVLAEPDFGGGDLSEPTFDEPDFTGETLADPQFEEPDFGSDTLAEPTFAEPAFAEPELPDADPPEPEVPETDAVEASLAGVELTEPEPGEVGGGDEVDAFPDLVADTGSKSPFVDSVSDAPETPPAEAVAPPPSTSDASPLALAVESFLAGGLDEARVRELAKQHTDVREYDPVATAVVRLVDEADGADSAALGLARELLGPLVRSAIVLQMGRERNVDRRQVYYDVCTKLGPEMANAIRDGMVDAPDRFARRAYFDAFVTMGEVGRPVVEAMAESDNRFLVRNAVAILGELGGERAPILIEAALANGDPKVRREALLSLARLKVEDADAMIVGRLVDDTDPAVRVAAVVAAGELHIERALRPLVAMLEEAYEPDEVLPLLHALGQIGDPGAVPAIEKHAVRELFAKPRTNVRIAAYQALNHIGTPHARRLLNKAVSDKDPEVKAVVKELLGMR